jgi:hypothetical protein
MVETWLIIVLVCVAVAVILLMRNTWKKWQRKYFNDANEDDGGVDIESLEFTIEKEDVVASRDKNRDMSAIHVPVTRTNSF